MKLKLDNEEKSILKDFEIGSYQPIKPKKDRIDFWKENAKNLNSDQRVNMRIPSWDLEMIKIHANRIGLPYQTLIKSIIHQYNTGKIKINF